jgi:hypothetical protein
VKPSLFLQESAWPGNLSSPNPTADLVGASREDVFAYERTAS